MTIQSTRGQPFVGFVTLTNGAPGPTVFTIIGMRNQVTTLTVPATGVLCITNIIVSSNDTANPLVSITDNAPTNPTTVFKAYTATAIPTPCSYPPGVLLGWPGAIFKASAPSVTSAKTIEITINGILYAST